MLVLAIETSCDETAIALLEAGATVRVVHEQISSQIVIHEQYGGVVPELAAREHLRNLPLMLHEMMGRKEVSLDALDLIAVTRGPGLKGCLLIGLDFAKGLAVGKSKPLIGVNHIEGHVLAPMLDNPALQFPYVALIVSGGHTEILEVRGVGNYRLLARTIDDAAGEAFDKSANLLGLAYPGGAKLAALADGASGTVPREFELPKVMRDSDAFSFSGLKTAIALLIRRQQSLLSNPEAKALLAKSIQAAIVTTLVEKLEGAVRQTGITQVAVSGGVSANKALRAAVSAIPGVTAYLPAPVHCMDNAAMIGYTAIMRYGAGERGSLNMGALGRWPVEEMHLGAKP